MGDVVEIEFRPRPALIDYRKEEIFFDAILERQGMEIEMILLEHAEKYFRATTTKQQVQITKDYRARIQDLME